MKLALTLWMLLALSLAGCVSRSRARLQAHNAYLMGQNQALLQAQQQQQQAQVPSVTVLGPVKNEKVPWTADLTLIRAIVAADYIDRQNPKTVTVTRNGETVAINPFRLWQGLDDIPLEAGDVVKLSH